MAQTIIHLDTSYLIRALTAGSAEDAELRRWLSDGIKAAISAPGWAEFLCGPLELRQVAFAKAIVGEPLVFVVDDAVRAAELFNRSGRRRGSLLDCMIAATAIGAGAPLATANHADFRKFAGLRLA
jgi:predicted nucleic acid-binding protein